MWTVILSFIGGPVIKGLIEAYNAHLKAQTADAKTAADLAAKEIAVQQVEIQAATQLKIAEIGHWYEPEKLAFYVTLFFYAKVLIYDKCFGLGSTPAVTGEVATWASLVMSFYFGKRGFENIARIIKR